MKAKRITRKLLTALRACEEGKEWWLKNMGENYLVADIKNIKGDYEGYIGWLRDNIRHNIFSFDENNNCIKHTFFDGDVETWKRDKNGNVVKHTFPSGHVETWEYENNNCIKRTFPNGHVETWKYENGNVVKNTLPNGDVETWEYENNMIIMKRNGIEKLMIPNVKDLK